MELDKLAENIRKKENGIYISKRNLDISYPEEGNNKCLQIEQDSFWFNHRNNLIIEAVKKFSPHSTFVDIGGGNGFVAKGLQEAGIKVVLAEPGMTGCINAKKRDIKNVICSTFEDAGFYKSSISAAGLFDVVEHIKDDAKFLTEIYNSMKKDGFIYITVPAFEFLWSDEDDDAGHYRRYSLTQMNNLLTKCGFKVKYSTYIFSILPLPIFLFRSMPSKLGLNKKSNDIEKHQNEHRNKKGVLNDFMQKVWDWEVQRIKNLKKIKFGGSYLVVAKK
jgi:SAM-dependent methyltransferase